MTLTLVGVATDSNVAHPIKGKISRHLASPIIAPSSRPNPSITRLQWKKVLPPFVMSQTCQPPHGNRYFSKPLPWFLQLVSSPSLKFKENTMWILVSRPLKFRATFQTKFPQTNFVHVNLISWVGGRWW